MYVKVWGKSDKRRPSANDGATADDMTAAQRLGMRFLTYMDIYRDSHHNGCQHRQREVTMAIMVYAVATFCISRLWDFVNMKRREYQHRQEYCQQNIR